MVLAPQQHLGAVDLRHLRPEACEDLGELTGDETTAEHNEPPRQLSYAHHVVGGVEPGTQLFWHLDGKRPGPRPRRDDDLVGADLHVADQQRVGVDETSVTLEQRHPRPVAAPLPPGSRNRVDAAEDAVADGGPVSPLEVQVDAEPGCLPRGHGTFSGDHEHLGGDAATIQTGAPEHGIVLDQSDVEMREPLINDGVARPGPDDGDIEMLHAPILSRPAASIPHSA